MPAYEAMFIFRADLKDEEQKALVGELEKILKENQSTIESSQVFGRRVLSYEINKRKEGTYYLINFSSPSPQAVANLKAACNIKENVLRVLVTKR